MTASSDEPGRRRIARRLGVFLTATLTVVALAILAAQNIRMKRALALRTGARPAATALELGDQVPASPLRRVHSAVEAGSSPRSLAEIVARQPALLYVFAPDCPYCVRSVPGLRALGNRLAGPSLRMVGVGLDGRGSGRIQPGALPDPWQVFVPVDAEAALGMGIHRVPTMVLLDKTGTIRDLWIGEVDATRVEAIEEASLRLLESEE